MKLSTENDEGYNLEHFGALYAFLNVDAKTTWSIIKNFHRQEIVQ